MFPYWDFSYAYKLDSSGITRTLYGHPVTKVKYRKAAMEGDPNIFESDLPKEIRVLTDLYLDNDEPAKGNVVAVIDIETNNEGGYPNVDLADKEISAISMKDKSTGEEYVFILDRDRELDDYEDAKNKNLTVLNAYSEEEMLSDFLNIWEQIHPTIVTGWNSDWFDVPYLYRRISRVMDTDEAARLSPIRRVRWSDQRQKYVIAGVSSLDYLDLYKKFTYTEMPNYKLDTVSKKELGRGKVEYEGSLDDLRREDIAKYLEYNLEDTRLVDELDDKKKLIQLVIGICSLGHVPYEDYGYSSRWLEGALIVDLHRKGIVCPNKPIGGRAEMVKRTDSSGKGFAGAYVKDPKVGRHDWVYSLDLQSLYPSIIMTLNISPETKVGKITNWNVEEHMRKQMPFYNIQDADGKHTKLTRDDFLDFMKRSNFSLSSNGILYRMDKVGIIPETLDRWFDERVDYKNRMKDAVQKGDDVQSEYWDMRQHIQKIFLNSMYGALGLPIFRFFDIDNALAVTASGQDVIKTSAKYANDQYIDVTNEDMDYCIYIDTDSLYFPALDYLKGQTQINFAEAKQMTIKLAREMETKLNVLYNALAQHMFFVNKHRLVIKGETVASAGFWVHKKRYALKKVFDLETNQDTDKLTIKGLDVVRSSFPKAFQKFMKEVLTDILDKLPKNQLDKKILEFYRRLPEYSIPDIARNTSVKNITKYMQDDQRLGGFMSGTPAHVKAAITHNLLLKQWNQHHMYSPIKNGDKIKWVYLKDNPYQAESVAFAGDKTDSPLIKELVKDFIDYDKIFEKEFSSKLEDFYKALNWGMIPTQVNQLASEFFSF